MKVLDIVRLSTRMFRTRPARTWLTILGISVGISTVIFLVSLGYGLQKIILERIVFSQALLSLTVTPSSDLITLNGPKLDELSRLDHVVDTAALTTLKGHALFGDINGSIDVKAADANYFAYAGVAPSQGELYKTGEGHKALLSEAVLRLLGVSDPSMVIGKQLSLRVFTSSPSSTSGEQVAVDIPEPYTIIGIVDDPQDSYVYVPLTELRPYVTVDHYDQVELKVSDGKSLPSVKDHVIERGYQVASLQETIDQANKIFRVFQVVLGLFGAVALVVSAIGMFNTMTVTLLERTNEIGIMRSLGASEGAIRSMFLTESVILGFLGGVTGILLGYATGQLFNFGINNLARHFGGSAANLFAYPEWFIIAVILISVVIGFLSGVFPSMRASKMDPLEALRYK